MKRIIRLLFYIPILPLIIIHYIALPTHWLMEKTLDFIHKIMDDYAYYIRKTFPWTRINHDKIWCFDKQERCNAKEKGCKFVKKEWCKLYDESIYSDKGEDK